MTDAPAMNSMTEVITAASLTEWGTTPSYSTPHSFEVMPLVTDSASASVDWQMIGVMGTLKYTFAQKTWPAFYYSTQVAYNG